MADTALLTAATAEGLTVDNPLQHPSALRGAGERTPAARPVVGGDARSPGRGAGLPLRLCAGADARPRHPPSAVRCCALGRLVGRRARVPQRLEVS